MQKLKNVVPGEVLKGRRGVPVFLTAILSVLLLALGLCAGAIVNAHYGVLDFASPVQEEKTVWEDRGAENVRIRELIDAGRSDEVLAFWAKYTKSTYNASIILDAAMVKEIPACMWFAQVKVENPTFDPRAIGGPNENGSYDLGMGQANDMTFVKSGNFPGVTRDRLLTVEFNMDILSRMFIDVYNGLDPGTMKKLRSAGSWDETLFFYNTGPWLGDDSRVPFKSVRRLIVIYEWERIFQRAFWERFSR